MKNLLVIIFATAALSGFSQTTAQNQSGGPGILIAEGFEISQFSGPDLADNIYSMTLDSRGRVVVSGPGYIRTLHDTNGDGKADSATNFARLDSGAMGMCFVGNDLYVSAREGLLLYRDVDGNSIADDGPEKLFDFAFAEHGAHAIRQGPDGWMYVIGGNDSGFGNFSDSRDNPPVKRVEAGAVLRFKPDGSNLQVFAHGFRNPYDFDFNLLGDVFTYDSDVESESLLPWYVPTRIFHVEKHGHHGWRRGWSRAGDFVDTVPMLAPAGRSSPTGVVNYRHFQFPAFYQGGLFTCDWTFGRVCFWPLEGRGSTYMTEGRLLLEPVVGGGFAPTDIAVAPDGSLLVSTGGRNTRGAVYKVTWTAGGEAATPTSEMEAVLNAPQPLEAWSRRQWEPLARILGRQEFEKVIIEERFNPAARIRAIEVLTTMFDGLSNETALKAASDPSAHVRARAAWSIGLKPVENFYPVAARLTRDEQPFVRRSATEMLVDQAGLLTDKQLLEIMPPLFEDQDERVRQTAARVATLISESAWAELAKTYDNRKLQRKLTYALAMIWRGPEATVHPEAAELALEVLKLSLNPDFQMQSVRLLQLALGDFNLRNPSAEVYSGYELAGDLSGMGEFLDGLRETARLRFPSQSERLDEELARLCVMIGVEDQVLMNKVVNRLGEATPPTSDFHYLAVLSRLPGTRSKQQSEKVAHAILSLDAKLDGLQQRPQQVWNDRLVEVVRELLERDPQLAESMLGRPELKRAGNLPLVEALSPEQQDRAARMFLVEVRENQNFTWSPALVRLLAKNPPEEVKDGFRSLFENQYALRGAIITELAKRPEETDRVRFLATLLSTDNQAARAAMFALLNLPPDNDGERLIPVMKLLRRLISEPRESMLRAQVIDLINHQTRESFEIGESGRDQASLRRDYQPVFDWYLKTYPNWERALEIDQSDDPVAWKQRLGQIEWDGGVADLGRTIFEQRGCQTCHAGRGAIGPELSGATERYSATGLFETIIFPHRDISPAYRPTIFQLADGRTVFGMIVFESAEGILLRTGPDMTQRIGNDQIIAREQGSFSLMPGGLLGGLSAKEIADLYAFMKTL